MRVHSTERELSQAEMWYLRTQMSLKIGALLFHLEESNYFLNIMFKGYLHVLKLPGTFDRHLNSETFYHEKIHTTGNRKSLWLYIIPFQSSWTLLTVMHILPIFTNTFAFHFFGDFEWLCNWVIMEVPNHTQYH